MLCLYLQAPFSVFRTMTTGSFRPTAEFITPSAAYGLLLNIAGIEMRTDSNELPMTIIKNGLPKIRVALGALEFPLLHSAYQQLHNYPVGSTGKEDADRTKGSKYNITPVRRSFLSDIKAYVCFDGNEALESKVKKGLCGESSRAYGLPFLGDNNFLIDKLSLVETIGAAYWYAPIENENDIGLKEHISRLTITIDREDMSKTTSALFAPMGEPSVEIPEAAWVEVGY